MLHMTCLKLFLPRAPNKHMLPATARSHWQPSRLMDGLWVLDLDTLTWDLLSGESKDERGPSARSLHAMAVLPGGNILIHGGLRKVCERARMCGCMYGCVCVCVCVCVSVCVCLCVCWGEGICA